MGWDAGEQEKGCKKGTNKQDCLTLFKFAIPKLKFFILKIYFFNKNMAKRGPK